ncbi:ion channel [Hanstruepera marina]|uniref:ion channel n=1 Tax=Hanstruepera marina TaxID=2873265 RepID=UPI001CA6A4F5|nr:ion channel [Hanstruepera marina]
MILKKLFKYRFELFFYSLITILFGSLIFPKQVLTAVVLPLLFVINIASGLVIFKKRKKQTLVVIGMLVLVSFVFFYRLISKSDERILEYIRFFVYFGFYALVTVEIISQVWNAKTVNKPVIYGLMSGYISLGLIGFFIFCCIEMINPGSFSGLKELGMTPANVDDLMYFSYITLMTIGYGDIAPVSDIAQKGSIFLSMMGQFYLVIVTAVVIEKYIKHTQKE